jgi:hypothetical protein
MSLRKTIMKRSTVLMVMMGLLSIAGLGLNIKKADALSCVPLGDYRTDIRTQRQAHIDHYPMIFEGKVARVEQLYLDSFSSKVTFEVTKYWKGENVFSTTTVRAPFTAWGTQTPYFQVGTTYLVFGSTTPELGNVIYIDCAPTTSLPQSVTEYKEVLGEGKIPGPGLTVPVIPKPATMFTRNLTVGNTGQDVTKLQVFLNNTGHLKVLPTGYFGSLTKKALAEYQKSVGIVPALGYFGPVTRLHVNKVIPQATP